MPRNMRKYPMRPVHVLAAETLAELSDRDLRTRMLALQRMPWTLPYGAPGDFSDKIVGKKSPLWKPAYKATKTELERRAEALIEAEV